MSERGVLEYLIAGLKGAEGSPVEKPRTYNNSGFHVVRALGYFGSVVLKLRCLLIVLRIAS